MKITDHGTEVANCSLCKHELNGRCLKYDATVSPNKYCFYFHGDLKRMEEARRRRDHLNKPTKED